MFYFYSTISEFMCILQSFLHLGVDGEREYPLENKISTQTDDQQLEASTYTGQHNMVQWFTFFALHYN
jgi:hypothetical protein